MTKQGKNFKHLLDVRLDADTMANEYAMDISATVYERMKQLGLKKKDLAERIGVSSAWVSKIIKGEQNVTLKTLARLEDALDIDMTYSLRHPKKSIDADYKLLVESDSSRFERKLVRDTAQEVSITAEVA